MKGPIDISQDFGTCPVRQRKGLGFPFWWKNRSPLESVTRSLFPGKLLKGICGAFEDKFSVAGSIKAAKAVTPRSSD